MTEAAFLTTIRDNANDAGPWLVYADWLEEYGDERAEQIRNYVEGCNAMLHFPGEVGDKFLICTVTLYYVGEVTEKGLGYVKLANASWVHWTGRLSELCKSKDFSKVKSRTPRTEPCGDVVIATQSIVAAYPGDWKLPGGAVQ